MASLSRMYVTTTLTRPVVCDASPVLTSREMASDSARLTAPGQGHRPAAEVRRKPDACNITMMIITGSSHNETFVDEKSLKTFSWEIYTAVKISIFKKLFNFLLKQLLADWLFKWFFFFSVICAQVHVCEPKVQGSDIQFHSFGRPAIIHFLPLIQFRVEVGLEPILAAIGWEAGYTLDYSSMGNLESPELIYIHRNPNQTDHINSKTETYRSKPEIPP